jgi:hypothetical protein
MPDYSDGVWPREMMQLMLSDDNDSGDVACELIACVAMTMLLVNTSLARREC